MMKEGKVRDAIRILSEEDRSRILKLNDTIPTQSNDTQTVLEILKSKHPATQSPCSEAPHKSTTPIPSIHPIIFDSIDGLYIRSAALKTFRARGPSRTNAYCWRRICTSFGRQSDELCHSLAAVAK